MEDATAPDKAVKKLMTYPSRIKFLESLEIFDLEKLVMKLKPETATLLLSYSDLIKKRLEYVRNTKFKSWNVSFFWYSIFSLGDNKMVLGSLWRQMDAAPILGRISTRRTDPFGNGNKMEAFIQFTSGNYPDKVL